MKTETYICDECKNKLAKSKCELCDKDLCSSKKCKRTFKAGVYITFILCPACSKMFKEIPSWERGSSKKSLNPSFDKFPLKDKHKTEFLEYLKKIAMMQSLKPEK